MQPPATLQQDHERFSTCPNTCPEDTCYHSSFRITFPDTQSLRLMYTKGVPSSAARYAGVLCSSQTGPSLSML